MSTPETSLAPLPSHTPAPWYVKHGPDIRIAAKVGGDEIDIAEMRPDGFFYEELMVVAFRITAAVNACEGIPTEALEAGAVADLLKALAMMIAAQDEADVLEHDTTGHEGEDCALCVARAALAKAQAA